MIEKFLVSFFLSLLVWRSVDETTPFYIPEGWPEPTYYFEGNPLKRDKFELGRSLFYDPILSRDSSISCASCHIQFSGFTHVDHPQAHGIDGLIGTRNSPVLINLAWLDQFNWDGGVANLNGHSINPITHPKEMDNSMEEVLKRLNNSTFYKRRFQEVWGDTVIYTPYLLKSIAAFTVSLVSANSKYDRVKQGKEQFTEQEAKGYKLFLQFCNRCHTEPLFTSGSLKRNGLSYDTELKDSGHKMISGRKKDSLLFKVPTLRNIEFSYPYMHDGRLKKLKEVLQHYSVIPTSKNKVSKELKVIKKPFSDEEQKDLIVFLKSLSDKSFLYNKEFMFPKNER